MENVKSECVWTVMKMFIEASSLKSAMMAYCQLVCLCDPDRSDPYKFYTSIRGKLNWWKVNPLWELLDKRFAQVEYLNQQAGKNLKALVVGAGPCGLRMAIECAFLGAKVVVLEKRGKFSRNNLLHIWPNAKEDLKNLGAKIFYPKFCVGSINHIITLTGICSLQLILLKVALLVGVEVFENVAFNNLIEPEMNSDGDVSGWKAALNPENHFLSDYQFNVIINADGKRNNILGFPHKEFRGKLAIGLTANFVNHHTEVENNVKEISGISYFYDSSFFRGLEEETDIKLENIVYYKEDTHYFVMTAKKQSLLERRVIIQDFEEVSKLLEAKNVCSENLLAYVTDVANFATHNSIPNLEFALNENSLPDVAMFDFTSLFSAENSSRFEQKHGRPLLLGLVGDSLHEVCEKNCFRCIAFANRTFRSQPFWPTGTGIGRGFMSVFDAAWMIRGYGCGQPILQILAERESYYKLLTQVTPETLSKNFKNYTIDPRTRYPCCDNHLMPNQVKPLVTLDSRKVRFNQELSYSLPSVSWSEEVKFERRRTLFNWLQDTLAPYRRRLHDFRALFDSGVILSMIICRYRRQEAKSVVVGSPPKCSVNVELCYEKVKSLWDVEAPDQTDNDDQVCEYLSEIKRKIDEEKPSSPTVVLVPAQAAFTELKDPILHGRVVGSELFKEQEAAGQREEEVDTDRRWLSRISGADRPAVGKLKPALLEMNKANNCWLPSGERSSAGKLDPELLQTVDVLLRGKQKAENEPKSTVGKLNQSAIIEMEMQLKNTHTALHQQPVLSSKEAKIIAEKTAVLKQRAQNGFQLNNDRFQLIDSCIQRLDKHLRMADTSGAVGVAELTKMHAVSIGTRKPPAPLPPPKQKPKLSSACYYTQEPELCSVCGKPAYMAERVAVEGLLFHKDCFRCAYCQCSLRMNAYGAERLENYGKVFFCDRHMKLSLKSKVEELDKNKLHANTASHTTERVNFALGGENVIASSSEESLFEWKICDAQRFNNCDDNDGNDNGKDNDEESEQ
ncbi:Protein-methionine sulfoxide oxidase MICAL2 [Trichinella pseudospiralis]|uniref:Protein-methionine sulfoxide oxidase MICAL2 n=1 Tax=Trichinella pseudospiralis TaxID=6337 RepID=A0A0V1IPV2_TRIPS|nr:Protein-methionine sulfoxide oxidase MICAL2 [Trichinella pseudospiralis]